MGNNYDFAFRVETLEDIRACFAEFEPYTQKFQADKVWRNNTKYCLVGIPLRLAKETIPVCKSVQHPLCKKMLSPIFRLRRCCNARLKVFSHTRLASA